jgi:hypothetical protein
MPETSSEWLHSIRHQRYAERGIARIVGDGRLGGRSGLVAPTERERRNVTDQPQPMPEPFFGGETIPFDPQSDDLTVSASDEYPVRYGGEFVTVVLQLREALTTAGEIELHHNGSDFATPAIPTGQTQIIFGPYEETFVPLDRALIAITDAGAGGKGPVFSWRFS